MVGGVAGQASLEGVDEAPCYFPTAAQFAEPLEYIASIRPEAERYGICRICPPPGWKPPFAHKPDKLKFATKEQDLGKLAGEQRLRRKFTENLRKFLFLIGKPMESAHGGKVFVDSHGGGSVDMFQLFKEVQRMGGHEAVTRDGGWVKLTGSMGSETQGKGLRDAYQRYLADFEAVHRGNGLDRDGTAHAYTPTVYREKPSVDADIRVGMTLWHFLEEEHGAGRCYHGTVKALRGSSCIVEYSLAERFPESNGRHPSRDSYGSSTRAAAAIAAGGWSGAGSRWDAGGLGGMRSSSCEEVEPFRVTLPKSQLSTLLLNGKSPAAAKLAAHGVVCEVCSIAAASNNVLAVCVACNSAYHLACVEPALPRVPFHDWFCGDCAQDGVTAEELARGSSGLFSALAPSKYSFATSPASPLLASPASPSSKKASKHTSTGSIMKPPSASKLPAAGTTSEGEKNGDDSKQAATKNKGGGGGGDVSGGGPVTPTPPGPASAKGDAAKAPSFGRTKGAAGPAATTPSKPAEEPDDSGEGSVEDGNGNEDEDEDKNEDEDGSEYGDGSGSGSGSEEVGECGDGAAGASASVSASRMRGLSRLKGRALKYGFGNGGVFTLKEYAIMADGWRSSYLARRGLGDDATEADMEAEFWKLVGPDPPEDDVKVLYGSDLDTGAVGSGFPWTRGAVSSPGKLAVDQAERPKPVVARARAGRGWDYEPDPNSYINHSYEKDGWNLNCLPTSDGSLLQSLGTQIQGVMVPWLYVGMAFSAFCWHNEDHYLYSINYLHAGSPKRWYGVPGSMAEKFESTVRSMFPELFEAHPDLLMQLVTMAHPSEVSKRGVRVSATTQREGEFVLTFPQAYHSGFNMGTNCAEAVNFAPPDWIPWGNAAQERYRLHKRKPVFSHEGLVLSLVDLLSKKASYGVHASGELTRFLRAELEVLAKAQEEETKEAERMGCARFEPMAKLVKRLRGVNAAAAATAAVDVGGSTIMRRRSSSAGGGGGCNSKDNGGGRRRGGGGGGGGGGILEGLESGSAVHGPRCSVCDQYCIIAVVVCDACDGASAGRAPARASSSGSPATGPLGDGGAAAARRRHSRRRFSCGRHLAELCPCAASEYTYYRRKDAAQLREAARGLTSSEEHREVWVVEAKAAVAAAKGIGGGGGGVVSSFRVAKTKAGGGDGGSGGSDAASSSGAALDWADHSGKVKLEAQQTPRETGAVASPAPNQPLSGLPLAAAAANGNDVGGAQQRAAAEAFFDDDVMDLQLDAPVDEDEAPLPSSLLPAGWNDRPSLRYIADLIRVGEELKAPERTLSNLRQVVDACAGWVKTIEGILGVALATGGGAAESTASAAAVTLFGSAKRAAASHDVGGDDNAWDICEGRGHGRGGRGAGARDAGLRSGTRAATAGAESSKRREQVPFQKAIKLLSAEARLPARPVETTERLCATILAACRLRQKIRSLLGLDEEEHIVAAKAMCLTIQEAGRKASLLELASVTVKPQENGSGRVTSTSCSSSYHEPKHSNDAAAGALSGGGLTSPLSPSAGADADSKNPGGGEPTPVASRVGSCRTRTRTNVSLLTGTTCAAERGTWKLQSWRLWPVHQPAAAALVEPCLSSVVAIPEAGLLKKALAALAERSDNTVLMLDSGLALSESGVKRGRDRSGLTAVGVGDGGNGCSGDGGGGYGVADFGGKTRYRGGGAGGSKAKFSGSPTARGGSVKGGLGTGGGVLTGAAHKRRRQDDS